MKRFAARLLISLATACLFLGVASAEVRLPFVLSNNMVLQKSTQVPIWGWADPGEEVTVTFEGQSGSAKADSNRGWFVHLDTTKVAGEGPFKLTVTGSNTIVVENILVGEVWVCSGQSNMEWPVSRSDNAEAEIAAAAYPKIRLYTLERGISSGPLSDVTGEWKECSPETVPEFSAVGYFFGRGLHQQLGVPIGLIKTAWGGTPSESWTSPEMVKAEPDFSPIVERWKGMFDNYPAEIDQFVNSLRDWQKTADAAEAGGVPVPNRPEVPRDPRANPHRPSGLYNAMIYPLIPYAIAGAIWYQGESNAGRAYQYRSIFPGMIKSWRDAWGQGDFSFYYVQLANFMERKEAPADSAWAELREAQTLALSLPNTGQAVIIDIGEADDIHPRNKQDVGWRLALCALAGTYDKNVMYSGPMYKSMVREGNKIRLTFDHIGAGLAVQGEGGLKGFAIAGEDKTFVWANAAIEGENVVVWSDQVAEPAAVRYNWADNPDGNLTNNAVLPACPFRTDDWPGTTVESK